MFTEAPAGTALLLVPTAPSRTTPLALRAEAAEQIDVILYCVAISILAVFLYVTDQVLDEVCGRNTLPGL